MEIAGTAARIKAETEATLRSMFLSPILGEWFWASKVMNVGNFLFMQGWEKLAGRKRSET
ncbi:MAG TPA: hypothetical protein V6C84_08060 [Coleofasciculaceae cyanobacterium]